MRLSPGSGSGTGVRTTRLVVPADRPPELHHPAGGGAIQVDAVAAACSASHGRAVEVTTTAVLPPATDGATTPTSPSSGDCCGASTATTPPARPCRNAMDDQAAGEPMDQRQLGQSRH